MRNLLPGYRVKMIDDNAFSEGVAVRAACRKQDIASEHRLKKLRQINSIPLPNCSSENDFHKIIANSQTSGRSCQSKGSRRHPRNPKIAEAK